MNKKRNQKILLALGLACLGASAGADTHIVYDIRPTLYKSDVVVSYDASDIKVVKLARKKVMVYNEQYSNCPRMNDESFGGCIRNEKYEEVLAATVEFRVNETPREHGDGNIATKERKIYFPLNSVSPELLAKLDKQPRGDRGSAINARTALAQRLTETNVNVETQRVRIPESWDAFCGGEFPIAGGCTNPARDVDVQVQRVSVSLSADADAGK